MPKGILRVLNRLVEKYERFLRIEVDDQAETGMRMRAVWVIGLAIVVMQFSNLAILTVTNNGWSFEHTLTVVVCSLTLAGIQFIRWHKNVFSYWVFFTFIMVGGVLASVWHDHHGINSPLVPIIALGPVMSGFIAGRRAAWVFWIIGSVLLSVLFLISITHPPVVAGAGYVVESKRFFQAIFTLSLAAIIAVNLHERLYSTLREMRMNAERANRAEAAKSEFLATMSHELRTPLNGVIGLTDALISGDLPARERELAQTIRRSGESLLLILNDLLDLSKVEAGMLSIEQRNCDLRELVRQVVDNWRENAVTKGLILNGNVSGDIPDMVMIDDHRTRQVLQNLISNGVKFTSHGHVSLHLHGTRLADGRYHLDFRITDTGKGIPPEMFERIFAPFEQGESGTTRRYGGTGLGLPISRRLTELMGGAIRVERSDASGTTFLLSLEAKIATEASLASGNEKMASQGVTLKGLKVLVAEDNEINRLVVGEFLKSWDVAVDFAVDGASCIERLKQHPYDLILMDKHMPGMNGVDATRAIRALPGPKSNIPIIAVTADAMPGERSKMLEAGMNEFISKPLRADALRDVILRTLNMRAAA